MQKGSGLPADRGTPVAETRGRFDFDSNGKDYPRAKGSCYHECCRPYRAQGRRNLRERRNVANWPPQKDPGR